MPNEAAHITLARRNQKTIDHLLQNPSAFAEWITTVAFYKALHIVEAIFARDKDTVHGRDHGIRANFLKSNNRYRNIWKHYRPLWAASTVARYLQDSIGTNREYTSFSQYLSPERVESEILGHRLHQIEKSAKKLLSKSAQKSLGLGT